MADAGAATRTQANPRDARPPLPRRAGEEVTCDTQVTPTGRDRPACRSTKTGTGKAVTIRDYESERGGRGPTYG